MTETELAIYGGLIRDASKFRPKKVEDPAVVERPVPERPTLYRKNGLLVGHIGRRITSEDVARILAEE